MPRSLDLDEKAQSLREFHVEYGRMPSYSEMQELFGYRSKNAVYYLAARLEEAGFLRRGPAGPPATSI